MHDELLQLKSLIGDGAQNVDAQTVAQLVTQSQVAQLYLNNKYTIAMSQLGWEMLFNFMVGESLSVMVSMVMRYLNVKVYHAG